MWILIFHVQLTGRNTMHRKIARRNQTVNWHSTLFKGSMIASDTGQEAGRHVLYFLVPRTQQHTMIPKNIFRKLHKD